jgi:hypothetical protein
MSEIRITDPNTGGQKGQKLARFDLIPPDPMWDLAEVYGLGSQKYADDNWLKGYRWRLSIGALLRHVFKFIAGEYLDLESGKPHLAHAVFHCFALMEFAKLKRGTDDRQCTAMQLPMDKANRIYIAGPMRGVPLYNFPAFDKAKETLTQIGWTAISPADLDRESGFDPVHLPADWDWKGLPPGFDFDKCRKRDLDALATCESIYLLRGWEQSTGAGAEYHVALWAKMSVIEER